MHPWHDIEYGIDTPLEVNAVVEVPKDSKLKYELDKQTGLLRLDRVLYSAVHYPGNYGFIPRTYWHDDDPLDILIISNFAVYPLTIVRARPIGVLDLTDSSEKDHKIIAVDATDPRFNRYHDLHDVSDHQILEIRHFFETYKELQQKKVEVLALESKKKAHECIHEGIRLYEEKFGPVGERPVYEQPAVVE
jgi:inorganic pyrophosphatase